MTLGEAVKMLGLQKCDFSDECDYCDKPTGSSYASISSGDGFTETNFYICESCAIKQAEESQSENAKAEEYEKQGHTFHCACRLVWGDGECECKLQGIIPGKISRIILNA